VNEVLHEYGLQHVRLFGFDSFQGLPLSAFLDDAGVWFPGAFKSNYRRAVEFMTQGGIDWQRTFLAKGWFSETATPEYRRRHDIQNASLIMIDCDMYLSTKDALKFCAPLIKDQAIVFFDDWNAHQLAAQNLGEQRAFAEFLHENPDLGAEEFGAYSFKTWPHGKVFRVFVKDTAHRGYLPSA
jgi:O-methyltransferase